MKEKEQLLEAIESKNYLKAIALINNSPELIETNNKQGVSVLMLALYHKSEELTSHILKEKNTFTIYELAAMGATTKLERKLKDVPEMIDSFSPDGFTPLGLASYFGRYQTAEFLVHEGANVNLPSENPMRVTPLHSAVAAGYSKTATMLIELGADVNAQQVSGNTALQSAVHNGNLKLAKLLLENGALPDLKANDGKVALDFVDQNKCPDLAELIISYL